MGLGVAAPSGWPCYLRLAIESPRACLALSRRHGPSSTEWDEILAKDSRRRIQAELRFLGYEVAELTVAKYMGHPSPRPSSTWRTFLGAHIGEIVAVDFFVVPTLTFRLLFGFLILQYNR